MPLSPLDPTMPEVRLFVIELHVTQISNHKITADISRKP